VQGAKLRTHTLTGPSSREVTPLLRGSRYSQQPPGSLTHLLTLPAVGRGPAGPPRVEGAGFEIPN